MRDTDIKFELLPAPGRGGVTGYAKPEDLRRFKEAASLLEALEQEILEQRGNLPEIRRVAA